jgi:tetrapyrrole methylase family protein/MazG family protein/ATP diphosphatase
MRESSEDPGSRRLDSPVAALPLDEQQGQSYPQLIAIMQRLLSPGGCPWDQEQSYESLRKYVLEEACEVIDAIDSGRPEALQDELGDLLLQVVFLGELARRDGKFGPDDVVRAIVEKLVRRHPHVFGEVAVSGSDEVLSNWDKIKLEEYGDRGVLAGLPRSFPALARAQRISDKVSQVGFDWPDAIGSRAKVNEELGELDEAVAGGDAERIESELGDVLFALVNFARHQGVNAEVALRKTADRFSARFAHVEARVKHEQGGFPRDERGKPTRGVPLETLDGYWNEAKERGL